jgi:hypothetical protein
MARFLTRDEAVSTPFAPHKQGAAQSRMTELFIVDVIGEILERGREIKLAHL